MRVEKAGTALEIGFRDDINNIETQTLEAVVTMPSLTRIDLAGGTDAMISGFNDSTLEANLAGAASLECLNVRYDFVSARGAGAAQLLMEDAAPLPAAHVELTGASLATLNMMDGATLTGSLAGGSMLQYYGSAVTVQVDTDLSSTVEHKGGTRNQ